VKSRRWHKALAIVLTCMVPVAVAGCTPEDRETAWDLFVGWLGENGTSAFLGSTGDSETDAALNPGEVLKDIKQADEHMEKARKNQDVHEAMKAVRLRPKDWTYRLSAATLMLEVSHVEWEDQFNEADKLAAENPWQTEYYASEAIRQLEKVRAEFGDRVGSQEHDFTNYQCESLFGQLAKYYKLRWDCCGHSKFDWDQYLRYKQDAERCRQ
jgi:hypothetical protein